MMNERIEAPKFDGSAPIQAHSKTEYKRLVTQGANVLPPGEPTPRQVAIAAWRECGNAFEKKMEHVAAEVISHARPQIVAEVEGEFKDAVIDALVVSHIYAKEHDTDARKAVADLLDYSVAVALDPQVSRPAAGLVAEARKAERELWVGLTEKEIDSAAQHYTESEGFQHGAVWADEKLKEKNT